VQELISTLEQALAAREATAEANDYNKGGTEMLRWVLDQATSAAPASDLDAQIDAGWIRLRAVQDELFELALRRIAREVLAKHATAATLRLIIRDPDKVGEPDRWSVEDEGLCDADGQVLDDADMIELEDVIGGDLDTLAATDEVYPAAVIDLLANPPTLCAADPLDP
jgi:hypothetical protein